MVLSSEAVAWMRAADTAGITLPPSVIKAREKLESIEAQLRALPAIEAVPTPAKLVHAGTPIEDASDEHRRLAAQARRLEETRRAAISARDVARDRLTKACFLARDELVLGVRDTVTAMIDRCRGAVEILEPFKASGYSEADIVRRANATQLRHFQKVTAGEVAFGAILAAHRETIRLTIRRPGGENLRAVPDRDIYWSNPACVSDDGLAGRKLGQFLKPVRIRPDILRVASEPKEAGFRLIAPSEMVELLVRQQGVSV